MDDTAMGQPGPGADDDHEDKGDRAAAQTHDDSESRGSDADSPLSAASEGLEQGLEEQGDDG